jgi:hypothetical protein
MVAVVAQVELRLLETALVIVLAALMVVVELVIMAKAVDQAVDLDTSITTL